MLYSCRFGQSQWCIKNELNHSPRAKECNFKNDAQFPLNLISRIHNEMRNGQTEDWHKYLLTSLWQTMAHPNSSDGANRTDNVTTDGTVYSRSNVWSLKSNPAILLLMLPCDSFSLLLLDFSPDVASSCFNIHFSRNYWYRQEHRQEYLLKIQSNMLSPHICTLRFV